MVRREPSPAPAVEEEPLGAQSVREVTLADEASAAATVKGQPVEDEAALPYYIATAPLFIGGDQFSRAHNVGDQVPAEHVEQYGWADKVRRPDTPEPETAPGQAPNTSKDGA
jgi:hypothetical protein